MLNKGVERMNIGGASDTEANFDRQETREKGDLEKRVDDNMAKFEAQFNAFAEDEPILQKAQELLEKYGSNEKIPETELDIDKSGFDDARLLAMVKLIEQN